MKSIIIKEPTRIIYEASAEIHCAKGEVLISDPKCEIGLKNLYFETSRISDVNIELELIEKERLEEKTQRVIMPDGAVREIPKGYVILLNRDGNIAGIISRDADLINRTSENELEYKRRGCFKTP